MLSLFSCSLLYGQEMTPEQKQQIDAALPNKAQVFQLQEPLFRDYLHVLLSIDVEKTGLVPERSILPVRAQDLEADTTPTPKPILQKYKKK